MIVDNFRILQFTLLSKTLLYTMKYYNFLSKIKIGKLMKDIYKLHKLAKDMSILYVEFNKKTRDELLPFFKSFFTLVDIAIDGEEGLKLYKKNRYDIVISIPNEMPKLSGIDMIKKIKEINPNQLMLIISEYDFSDFSISFLNQKTDRFLLKPFSAQDLILVLENLSETFHQREGDLNLIDKKELTKEDLIKLQNEIVELKKDMKSLHDKIDEIGKILLSDYKCDC